MKITFVIIWIVVPLLRITSRMLYVCEYAAVEYPMISFRIFVYWGEAGKSVAPWCQLFILKPSESLRDISAPRQGKQKIYFDYFTCPALQWATKKNNVMLIWEPPLRRPSPSPPPNPTFDLQSRVGWVYSRRNLLCLWVCFQIACICKYTYVTCVYYNKSIIYFCPNLFRGRLWTCRKRGDAKTLEGISSRWETDTWQTHTEREGGWLGMGIEKWDEIEDEEEKRRKRNSVIHLWCCAKSHFVMLCGASLHSGGYFFFFFS